MRSMAVPRTAFQPSSSCSTTAGGKLVFHIFGALAESERELIWEQFLCGEWPAGTR